MPITTAERAFVEARRIAHLATADEEGVPHVVPICFILMSGTLYSTVDQKPKRAGARLKRLANIERNPHVSVVMDRYDEDWSRLGWVMLKGWAEILQAGAEEHAWAQAALRARYPQYAAMELSGLPVIAIRIERCQSWGNLAAI